ncbi:APC family permease [Clostridium sediminicola]|uniref:APC family permease n=1 Tax=Clostridium sediminicola TaxID=3114879 RepID=UPI0031F2065C
MEQKHLSKVLGPMHIWALGVGIVLVGQFMGWNFTIVKGGSLGSIIACWTMGILYISLIMINTEIGSVIPEAGGQYAMAKYLLGPLAAFNIGLMLVFEYVMLEAADALVVGQILETISPDVQALPYIVLSLLALTYLNYRGMHATLNLNIVLTGIAFMTILILLFSTKFYSPSQSLLNLSEFANGLPYGWMGILGAFQFGCWFYLGIEGTVLAAEECRSTGRSLPIGAIVGLVTLMIGATITWFVCSGLVHSSNLAESVYPLFDAAIATRIPFVVHSLFLGTLLACLASANGCIADASRAWYSMSKDTLIPGIFAVLHPKYKTPYRAIVFLLPIAIAFGFTGLLDQVITFSIFSALLVYLLTAYMMFKFRKMYPLGTIERGYISPLHPLPAIILIVLALATLIGMYFGYWINIVSGCTFYLLASLWFTLHRSKFLEEDSFIAGGTSCWPKPEGY